MSGYMAFILLSPVWLWFIFQPIANHVNMVKQQFIENVVHTGLEEAKIKGYFSTADLTHIQDTVASSLGYPTTEVSVEGTEAPQSRGADITLQVDVPTRVAFLDLWGESNKMTIGAKESAMSEALLR